MCKYENINKEVDVSVKFPLILKAILEIYHLSKIGDRPK